jgi:hypothetical protein
MGRRNLNAAHKLELQFANKDELIQAGKETQGRRTDLLSDTDKKSLPDGHDTRQQIAAAAGVATGKVAMAASIPPEANRKRSEKAKEQPRTETGFDKKQVVVPEEQVPGFSPGAAFIPAHLPRGAARSAWCHEPHRCRYNTHLETFAACRAF